VNNTEQITEIKNNEKPKLAVKNNTIYLLPIRNGVIFPGVYTPLTITNKADIEIINQAQSQKGIGLILLKDKTPGEIEKEITPFEGKLDDSNEESFISQVQQIFNISMDEYRNYSKNYPYQQRYYHIGSYARIIKTLSLPDGSLSLYLNVINRFSVKQFFSNGKFLIANVDFLEDDYSNMDITTQEAYKKILLHEISQTSANTNLFNEEIRINVANINSPGRLCDYISNSLEIPKPQQQELLEITDVKKRIEKVLFLLKKETSILELRTQLENKIKDEVNQKQKEFILKEELKSIQAELGIINPESTNGRTRLEKLVKKFEKTKLNKEAEEAIKETFDRMYSMDPFNHEYSILESYVQTVLDLPWNKFSRETPYSISKARQILDHDHYGIKDVKQRILEFIAVRNLKKDNSGSIICLEGPPGVGKTSIGFSIARTLSKKCFRFSVGGVRDEAEIKGHRRTYIGAMPGKIIQGLKITQNMDPVFLIDEIDKLQNSSVQGDPASALLEVLDPEQNKTFRDHYLDVPFDISHILFIVTANDKSRIPRPLLDRMEVIEVSGYTSQEKLQIGKNYLLPKARKNNGLTTKNISFTSKILGTIADSYAREAGVRNYEKAINKICRKVALEQMENPKSPQPTKINQKNIKKYLGDPIFREDEIVRASKPGMSIGLAYTGFGGATLAIEAIKVPGKGALKLTGQLGDVMKESADIAYTYMKSVNEKYKIDSKFFTKYDFHVHFPDGATPKDGPSAGGAICSALFSLFTGKLIDQQLAMTGELTLTGRITEIGGVKEKLLAVKRNRFTKVILPLSNKKDVIKLDKEITSDLTFYFVNEVSQVLDIAFDLEDKDKTLKTLEVLDFTC